uniref:Uncharacterized protein n=1 Tax=Myoviridae sp. ctWiL39 TaxID=2825120 RepID=A0A8S5PWY8_9CAUD|nr:MAG TPA: hypothetical protein [Myoviridae sp. ctWiL39]
MFCWIHNHPQKGDRREAVSFFYALIVMKYNKITRTQLQLQNAQ